MAKPIVPCSIPDCPNNAWARGWCRKHYWRWHKYGDPTKTTIAAKGTGTIYKGYRIIYVNGVQYREHRYIMEQFLGRELRINETVHHKNGNKLDNRIENLEVMTVSEHQSHHHPRKYCSIERCGRPHLAKGLCIMHYARQKKNGDTGQVSPLRKR